LIAKVFDRYAGYTWLILDTVAIILDSRFHGAYPLLELRPMPENGNNMVANNFGARLAARGLTLLPAVVPIANSNTGPVR
jgi:hypothetical protein